jgi:hypothetical protein
MGSGTWSSGISIDPEMEVFIFWILQRICIWSFGGHASEAL